MISIGLNVLANIAKTAVVSSISGKIIDSVISTRLNKNTERKKWMRETKLTFFTKLTQEILSYDLHASNASDEKRLKEYSSKIILLVEDKRLILKIEAYIKELNKVQRLLIYEENNTKELMEDFNKKGLDLVLALNKNLKRS